jgi:transcription antitermination factor NusG
MNVWNAIYVSSRQEKKIQATLHQKGIEAYVPLKKVLRQWSDRKKWITIPFISGYVFVQSSEFKKDIILQTPGVVSFVRYNSKAAVIRQSEIDTLKNIESFGYEIDLAAEQFTKGDQLTVFQGPLKGLQVQLLEVINDDFIGIFLVESLGQNFKIKLQKAVLKKQIKI